MIKSHKKLGEKLRVLREIDDISIRHVGRHTKICPGVISRIERGVTKISFENAVVLCEYYAFPITELASTLKRKNSHGKTKNKG